ncbi:hypothetical protein [Pseudosporangium ferrugineum]|uniref:hypothetical protein n=1 Tax=Pseudosporangium ferrugineum TaxID=439699 RepID=UPI0013048833|nr:hypothetical protein [Pseudosporangium ferrugineum]
MSSNRSAAGALEHDNCVTVLEDRRLGHQPVTPFRHGIVTGAAKDRRIDAEQ